MRYRNRIRNLEKRVKYLDNPERSISKNSSTEDKTKYQKLSDVKTKILLH